MRRQAGAGRGQPLHSAKGPGRVTIRTGDDRRDWAVISRKERRVVMATARRLHGGFLHQEARSLAEAHCLVYQGRMLGPGQPTPRPRGTGGVTRKRAWRLGTGRALVVVGLRSMASAQHRKGCLVFIESPVNKEWDEAIAECGRKRMMELDYRAIQVELPDPIQQSHEDGIVQ